MKKYILATLCLLTIPVINFLSIYILLADNFNKIVKIKSKIIKQLIIFLIALIFISVGFFVLQIVDKSDTFNEAKQMAITFGVPAIFLFLINTFVYIKLENKNKLSEEYKYERKTPIANLFKSTKIKYEILGIACFVLLCIANLFLVIDFIKTTKFVKFILLDLLCAFVIFFIWGVLFVCRIGPKIRKEMQNISSILVDNLDAKNYMLEMEELAKYNLSEPDRMTIDSFLALAYAHNNDIKAAKNIYQDYLIKKGKIKALWALSCLMFCSILEDNKLDALKYTDGYNSLNSEKPINLYLSFMNLNELRFKAVFESTEEVISDLENRHKDNKLDEALDIYCIGKAYLNLGNIENAKSFFSQIADFDITVGHFAKQHIDDMNK